MKIAPLVSHGSTAIVLGFLVGVFGVPYGDLMAQSATESGPANGIAIPKSACATFTR